MTGLCCCCSAKFDLLLKGRQLREVVRDIVHKQTGSSSEVTELLELTTLTSLALRRGHNTMAREITEEILRSMKLEDGPSPFVLVVPKTLPSPGYTDILSVSTPDEDGVVIYRVTVFGSSKISGGVPHYTSDYSDADGALPLIDGMLRKHTSLKTIYIFPVGADGQRDKVSIGSWRLPVQTSQE